MKIEDIYQKGVYKCDNVRPVGYQILIRILADESEGGINKNTGEKSLIYIPKEVRRNEAFESFRAEVIAIGPLAYKAKHAGDGDVQVKVGDFVYVPRDCCDLFRDRGVPVAWISDTMIKGIIEDPRLISKIGDIENEFGEF